MNQSISDKKLKLKQEIKVAEERLFRNLDNANLASYINPSIKQIPAALGIFTTLFGQNNSDAPSKQLLNSNDSIRKSQLSSYLKYIPDILKVLK